MRGTPAPVLQQVAYSAQVGSAQLAFSQTGTLVYRSGGNGSGLVTVQWLDGTGRTQTLLAKPGSYSRPRLSADGKRLALNVLEGSNQDFMGVRIATRSPKAVNLRPIYSPSDLESRWSIYRVPRDGEACSGPAPMEWVRRKH